MKKETKKKLLIGIIVLLVLIIGYKVITNTEEEQVVEEPADLEAIAEYDAKILIAMENYATAWEDVSAKFMELEQNNMLVTSDEWTSEVGVNLQRLESAAGKLVQEDFPKERNIANYHAKEVKQYVSGFVKIYLFSDLEPFGEEALEKIEKASESYQRLQGEMEDNLGVTE